jgi:hypothetical protein
MFIAVSRLLLGGIIPAPGGNQWPEAAFGEVMHVTQAASDFSV